MGHGTYSALSEALELVASCRSACPCPCSPPQKTQIRQCLQDEVEAGYQKPDAVLAFFLVLGQTDAVPGLLAAQHAAEHWLHQLAIQHAAAAGKLNLLVAQHAAEHYLH